MQAHRKTKYLLATLTSCLARMVQSDWQQGPWLWSVRWASVNSLRTICESESANRTKSKWCDKSKDSSRTWIYGWLFGPRNEVLAAVYLHRLSIFVVGRSWTELKQEVSKYYLWYFKNHVLYMWLTWFHRFILWKGTYHYLCNQNCM